MIKVKCLKSFAGSLDGINVERYTKDEATEISVAFFNKFGHYFIKLDGENTGAEVDENQLTIEEALAQAKENKNPDENVGDDDQSNTDKNTSDLKDVDEDGNPIDRSVFENEDEENKDPEEVEDPEEIIFEEDWLRVNKSVKELKELCKELEIKGYSNKNEDELIDMLLAYDKESKEA